MTTARIHTALPVHRMTRGEAFEAHGVRGEDAELDPFLMIDHFRMRAPTFGAHPHAGFSAVTYLFDDATGGLQNRDARGDDSQIRAGDLHWTIAGRGTIHDETPLLPGREAHGLQLFVNLPAADKWRAPDAIHLERERMPRLRQPGGAEVKLVFGGYDDGRERRAPVAPLPTEVALFDVHLCPGAAFRYPLPPGRTALLLAIAGTVRTDGANIAVGQAVAFDRSGGEIVVDVDAGADARFALLTGTPLDEPVARHGPFAMGSPADLARVIDDYRAGRFGQL